MALLNYNNDNLYIDNWIDVFINECKKRGFIITTDLSHIKYDFGYQLAWGFDDKKNLLNTTTFREKNPLTNIYISLNAFKLDEIDNKPNRRIVNLEQIRNIGIDIDYYKLGLTKEYVLKKIEEKILIGEIPNPNLLIHSGNGIQLIYGIFGGLPPKSKNGFDFCNYTVYIANQICSNLVDIGVDTTCTSLDSLFRLPHTFNKKEKYGKEKKFVEVEIWNKREYMINELYDYCKPIEHIQTRKRKSVKKYKDNELIPFKDNKGLTLRSLNSARLYDFLKLIELRKGEIEKRNVLTYDYAFCLSLINDNLDYVFKATSDINDLFSSPQNTKELIRTTKNGYKDGQKFWKAYVDNDFNMFGLDKRLIKPKKNETIINEHEITVEEQQELNVLISKEVKYKRNNYRRCKVRLKEGKMSKEQYNSNRKEKTNDILKQIESLLEKNYKQKDIALQLNLTKGRVSQLVKQIKNKKV